MGASHSGEPGRPGDLDIAAWVFENSVDVFVVVEDERIARVNPAWTRLTGWAAEETQGRSPDDFVHPDHQETMRSAAAAVAPWRGLRSRSSAPRQVRGLALGALARQAHA